MNKLKLARGSALLGIALLFGVPALSYRVGSLARAGAGLFPLLVSGLVGVIGLVMLVQARFEAPEPVRFGLRNILLIMTSLVGFALIAKFVSTIPAIVFLVFVAGLAGADYSLARNLKISAVLIVIAFGFRTLLGLNLPLY